MLISFKESNIYIYPQQPKYPYVTHWQNRYVYACRPASVVKWRWPKIAWAVVFGGISGGYEHFRGPFCLTLPAEGLIIQLLFHLAPAFSSHHLLKSRGSLWRDCWRDVFRDLFASEKSWAEGQPHSLRRLCDGPGDGRLGRSLELPGVSEADDVPAAVSVNGRVSYQSSGSREK